MILLVGVGVGALAYMFWAGRKADSGRGTGMEQAIRGEKGMGNGISAISITKTFEPDSAPAAPAASIPNEPLLPIATLEQRFRSTRAADQRIEVAREIAGHNDSQAVRTITRLFPIERHPDVQMALLAALADIDDDEALDSRLAVLAMALRGKGRDLRTTALDVLERLDDPRAISLIEQTMKNDPDVQVREVAAALYNAQRAADSPR